MNAILSLGSSMKVFAGFLAVLSLTYGCQSTSFQGSGSKNPATKKVQDPEPTQTDKPITQERPAGDKTVTETLAVTATTKSKIDIVWAIDNSGSMTEEAAQVRANLERFVSSLNQGSNVKLALLSADELSRPSTGVTLSTTALSNGHVQVTGSKTGNTGFGFAGGIGSYDALAAIAKSVCPVSSTTNDPITSKICGVEQTQGGFGGYDDTFAGTLESFFRPDARTVFVVVTDDNALGVDEKNFMTMIKGHIPDPNPLFYGFIGTDDAGGPGCSIAQRGKAYEALALATGGETYDICQSDWSSNFDKLTNHVQQSVGSEYQLKTAGISSVVSVVLDGKPLAADQYTLVGQALHLKEGVLTATDKQIVVTLSVKE